MFPRLYLLEKDFLVSANLAHFTKASDFLKFLIATPMTSIKLNVLDFLFQLP